MKLVGRNHEGPRAVDRFEQIVSKTTAGSSG